jgi:hypothetical protein
LNDRGIGCHIGIGIVKVDGKEASITNVASKNQQTQSLKEAGQEEIAGQSLQFGLVNWAAAGQHEGEPGSTSQDNTGDGKGPCRVEFGVKRRRHVAPARQDGETDSKSEMMMTKLQ